MITIYACHNQGCSNYGVEQAVILEDLTPDLYVLPYRVICKHCGCDVPIVQGTLMGALE